MGKTIANTEHYLRCGVRGLGWGMAEGLPDSIPSFPCHQYEREIGVFRTVWQL